MGNSNLHTGIQNNNKKKKLATFSQDTGNKGDILLSHLIHQVLQTGFIQSAYIQHLVWVIEALINIGPASSA